jgi:hypothetical protein
MPTKATDMNWEDFLRDVLIAAGTNGLMQTVLVKRFSQFANAEMLVDILEDLRSEDKVQKFIVPSKGRNATYWRATTKMLSPDTA